MSRYINQGNGTREHQLIARKILGRKLRNGECVHHLDEDGTNNVHSNLVICPSEAYHALLHMRTEALNACGNANYRKCKYCRQWGNPKSMYENKRRDRVSPAFSHKECKLAYDRERYRTRGERLLAELAVDVDALFKEVE